VAAIGAGRIALESIHSETEFIYGETEGGGRITVNPALPIVETTIHECLHRLRWQWSERAVRTKTTQIMKQLSDREIDRLHDLIVATDRRRKRHEPKSEV